jgi:hypothetical protein
MTKLHFEDLWEKGEQFHKDTAPDDSVQSIIDEAIIKLNLYKAIDLKSEIAKEEKDKIKSHTLGEILLSLTNLSLHDNINVFESLSTALKYRTIQSYNEKYKD